LEAWKARDPVSTFRARLLAASIFAADGLAEIEASVQSQLDEAVAFAAASPLPAVAEALAGVYADTHEGLVF
jgi:pyruvate dehydrogenase E1 component alpha subunit